MLKFTQEAKQDLDDIPKYIKYTLFNTKAADDLIDNFEKAFQRICIFPQSGSAYKKRKGYRKLLVNNFLALYKTDDKMKEITVYRILYAYMNIEKQLK
ncbi:MAG: type II toxin-antitoxin system RelE/ParE family toxin [Clostridiales bacterium]|nr:type II toxin-antitoxin system RelE/ParE family toxin [Clostridiales bacterium]